MNSFPNSVDLAPSLLAAVVAHSQIVVPQPVRAVPLLPAGFDEVDIAILDWIAAEGRRASRDFVRL